MELRNLIHFVAVAEECHFGKASERVGVVQSAVSTSIRLLEEELGVRLLLRTSRRVELTEAGRLFLHEAKLTLEQADKARRVATGAAQGVLGRLKVGFVGGMVFSGEMVKHLKRLHATHPRIEVELQELPTHAQVDALMNGRLDVGYFQQMSPGLPPDLVTRTIGSWHWVLAVSPGHPLATRERLAADDLHGETFILYAKPASDIGQLDAVTRLLGYEPQSTVRVTSTLAALALTAAGLGVALIPSTLTGVAVLNLVHCTLAVQLDAHDIYLVHRKFDSSPTLQALLGAATGPSTSS